jgi:NADPH2:quinone reductase
MKAIQVQSTGGPEVLQLQNLLDPLPHAGDVLVRVHTFGVNFMDVYYREGKYKAPLPRIPGATNLDTSKLSATVSPISRSVMRSHGWLGG